MLTTKAIRTPIRTLRGWALAVLQEAGAIRECEEHGWARDRADPHARERAFDIARRDPPPGVSPNEAVTEICNESRQSATPTRNAHGNTELESGPTRRACRAAAPSTLKPRSTSYLGAERVAARGSLPDAFDEFYRRALGKPSRDALGIPIRETDTPVRFRLGHPSRKPRAV